jgi:hypothetical protein
MICVLCGAPMAEEELAHRSRAECQEACMTTVLCKGCRIPLESDMSEAEMLAFEQSRDPEVGEVEVYCQVCLALQLAAFPDAIVYDDANVLGPRDEEEEEES